MRVFTDLLSLPPTLSSPVGLTIGTFDGVHLGHQALFQALRKKIGSSGSLTVLTFSNHPADLLSHRPPSPLLVTIEHKLKLLEEAGVDQCILVPFTQEFSSQSFEAFLTQLKQRLHFTDLVLGTGASLGKNREGDESHVRLLSQALDFSVDYLPKCLVAHQPISSGRIRTHLVKGEFAQVEQLLGRPYSIFSNLIGSCFELPGLCLPPEGTYPIHFKQKKNEIEAKALVDPKTGIIQFSFPDLALITSDPAEAIFHSTANS